MKCKHLKKMASLLTGEQMIGCRARLDRELPSFGFKEFQPSKTAFEQQQIQHALEVRQELLNEERIEKCGNLSSAQWMPELMRAKVTKKVGKHWEVFGHYKDNCEWLFPEEALFMLETNSLELLYHDVPVSVQKGYAVLINNSKTDCTLSEYRVYSHLSRQGYRVLRHLPDLTITSYKKQINFDHYILDQKCSYDLESKRTQCSVLEQTVSLSESENKEDCSNMSEDMASVSRTEQLNFKVSVQEDIKFIASNMPSTSGTVLHDVVVLDESTVESEIIEEPLNQTTKLEEDDDLDVVEVPQEPKEIIIETIDSDTTSEDNSDDENEEDSSSDSESDGDIHWKRRSFQRTSSPVEEVNEKYAIRSNYATIQEFLFDRESAAKKNKPVVVIDLVDDGNETVENELNKFYNEIELIDLASDTENETSYVDEYVKKSRREILDGMPVINNVNGYVSVTCPDLRLIPHNVRPKNHEYKLHISNVRGGDKPRQTTNYRNYRYYSQHRNYHGRGYQHMNSLFNRMRANPWERQSNQGNMNPILMQQATQIQSLAQGMMQFASTLMNQMCQPQMNTNNNWNMYMNMTRFSNPAWQGTELFNTNTLVQRNVYNEQRTNENTNYAMLPFGQNSNPYHQHQMPAQSNNSFRNQYNLSTVKNYTNSMRNENSPVYHVNASNFSPNNNSFSQNSSSSVDNQFEVKNQFDVNNGVYSPVITNRFKRFHRRGGGGFQRGGGGRTRHSVESRHSLYQVNSMTVEENRRGDTVSSSYSCADPAYSRDDVPIRGDDFIPLSSGNNKNKRKKNLRNNRRKRKNFEVVNVDVVDDDDNDDDITVIQTSNKCLKQDNNQNKRKRQDKNSYFLASPVRKLRKQEEENGDETEIIDIDVTPEELDVKQEKGKETSVTSEDAVPNHANDIADVKPNVSETVSEAAYHTCDSKFKITDVKTEKSADTDFSSNSPSALVKNESAQEQQQLNQEQCTSKTNKDIKPDMLVQLDTKNNISLTQNVVIANISEKPQVKTESDLENQNKFVKIEKDISYNNINRTENNCKTENEVKQEPITEETVKRSEDVAQSEFIENSGVSKETRLQKNVNDTDNSSVRPVTSWAEYKSRSVPSETETNILEYIYEENEGTENTVEEVVQAYADDQPVLKPEDCKTIGSVLSVLQIFNKGETPQYKVCKLKISFDMYLPSSTFKKVQRTLPNYRIIVVESLDPLPSPSQMAELRLRFQDGVQILLAVVMPDSVAFYAFGSVCLPMDDTSYKM